MLNFLGQVWQDENLYGHCLTRLPHQLWNAANSSNHLWTDGKSEDNIVEPRLPFLENHTKIERYSNGNIRKITFSTRPTFLKYIELGCRIAIGTCLTGISLTIAPLGFAIKIIHKAILG